MAERGCVTSRVCLLIVHTRCCNIGRNNASWTMFLIFFQQCFCVSISYEGHLNVIKPSANQTKCKECAKFEWLLICEHGCENCTLSFAHGGHVFHMAAMFCTWRPCFAVSCKYTNIANIFQPGFPATNLLVVSEHLCVCKLYTDGTVGYKAANLYKIYQIN